MRKQRELRLTDALITLFCFGIMIFLAVLRWDMTPHIPMLLGCIAAAAVSLARGCKWSLIQQGMVESIAQSLESIIILLLISVLMGVWIQSGVVPAMIYYGLKVMAPSIFLPCAMVITSAVSMVVGSWGSTGTLGLALMGISQALGIPAPLTAGAIISGAYVGDQLSPLSDSTNLTGAVIGVSVFEHVRFLSPVAGCSYLLALTGYFLAGLHYRSGTAETIAENTGAFLSSISSAFSLSPLLFLPMILLIFCILRRVPAILGISAGILSAGVLGALMQGSGLSALMRAAKEGYAGTTGNSMVDRLLTAGGLDAMMPSISLIIIAMMFGGILEKSGQMRALTAPVMRLVHSLTGLTGAVVLTSILSNITMPDQYVAVALPGRMFRGEYDRQSIDRRKLGIALSGGAIATSALVPWNTCGSFMAGVLGVPTLSYAQYAFFNLSMPVLAMLAMAAASRKGRLLQQQGGKTA